MGTTQNPKSTERQEGTTFSRTEGSTESVRDGTVGKEAGENESGEGMPGSLRSLRAPLCQVSALGGIWDTDRHPRSVEKEAESRQCLCPISCLELCPRTPCADATK